MRKFVLIAALAVAALAFADTAQAQVIVNGGYSQGYYGGYSPGYYGSGGVVQSGYYNNYSYGTYPSYGNYPSYNTGYFSSGYSPSYSGYSNYSPALDSYYSFYRRGAYGNSYPSGGRRWR